MDTQSDDARALRSHIEENGPKYLPIWDALPQERRELHAGIVPKHGVHWAFCAFLAYET